MSSLNSLSIMHEQLVLINAQTGVTITCGIQPTVVTMAMKVLHNTLSYCTAAVNVAVTLAIRKIC